MIRKYSLPLAIAVLCGVALVEIGFRYLRPRPPGSPTFENYTEPRSSGLGKFSPELGWLPFTYPPESRPYRITDERVRLAHAGAILAIGGSSTHGGGMRSKYAWPAQLERRLRLRVVNGGVVGYGLGQMLVRTKKTLEWLDPDTVIFAVSSEDISFTRLMVREGVSQPYFRINTGGDLELVPASENRDERGWFRRVFGYSYAAHIVLRKAIGNLWLAGSPEHYQDAPVDFQKVSKKIVDAVQEEVVTRRGKQLVFVFLPGTINDTGLVERGGEDPGVFDVAEHIRARAAASRRTYLVDLQSRFQSAFPDAADRPRYGSSQSGHYNRRGMAFVARNLASLFAANGKVVAPPAP